MYHLMIEQSKHSRGKNWVAKITGTDPKFGFAREFVRGIVIGWQCQYSLTDGIYEISEPRSLGKTYRHFVRVTGDRMTGLSQDDMVSAIRAMEVQRA